MPARDGPRAVLCILARRHSRQPLISAVQLTSVPPLRPPPLCPMKTATQNGKMPCSGPTYGVMPAPRYLQPNLRRPMSVATSPTRWLAHGSVCTGHVCVPSSCREHCFPAFFVHMPPTRGPSHWRSSRAFNTTASATAAPLLPCHAFSTVYACSS